MKNEHAILDETGIIHSGTEEEMLTAWDIMTRDIYSLSENDELSEAFRKYHTQWKGDLLLVHIINRTR